MSDNVLLPLMEADVEVISKLPDEPTNEATQDDPNGMSPDAFKAKFDEGAKSIKEFLNKVLIPAVASEKIPFKSSKVNGDTITQALEWLKDALDKVQAGELVGLSITEEMLTSEVRNLLNSGKPVYSDAAPTADANYPIGQIWLRTEDGTAAGAVRELYVQIASKRWWSYGHDILPVNRGGTGKNSFLKGGLLYGDGGTLRELATPTEENTYLAFENNAPVWKDIAGIGDLIERIKVASGTYNGTGKKRELSLGVIPKVIFITNQTGASVTVGSGASFHDAVYVLPQGGSASRQTGTGSGISGDVTESVKLEGDKLVFGTSSDTSNNARCANYLDHKYDWVAIY